MDGSYEKSLEKYLHVNSIMNFNQDCIVEEQQLRKASFTYISREKMVMTNNYGLPW